MPLPVIANTFRVAMHWTCSEGGYGVNVMHFGTTLGTESFVRDTINANWQNEMQETMSSTLDQDQIDVINLGGTDPTRTFDGVGNSTGQSTGQPVTSQATIVSFQTTSRGPRYRGRIFMPGLAEDAVDNGTLDPTKRETQQDAWNAFIEAMAIDEVYLLVASYEHASVTAVLNAVVRPIAGTQQRRLKRLR